MYDTKITLTNTSGYDIDIKEKNKCDDCEIKKLVIDGLKMIAGGKRKIEEAITKK